jgi:hypothetical protein
MRTGQEIEKPRVWVRGASLRGAGDELGLVAGDANVIAMLFIVYTYSDLFV